MSIISLENVWTFFQQWKIKKLWYMHNLLDVINNCTKLQLNQIRTYHFQLKQFDIAVTLKYNKDRWKWCEWVKFSDYYHHAKFDIYYVNSVQENHTVKVFTTYGQAAGWPETDHHRLIFSCESKKQKNLVNILLKQICLAMHKT